MSWNQSRNEGHPLLLRGIFPGPSIALYDAVPCSTFLFHICSCLVLTACCYTCPSRLPLRLLLLRVTTTSTISTLYPYAAFSISLSFLSFPAPVGAALAKIPHPLAAYQRVPGSRHVIKLQPGWEVYYARAFGFSAALWILFLFKADFKHSEVGSASLYWHLPPGNIYSV